MATPKLSQLLLANLEKNSARTAVSRIDPLTRQRESYTYGELRDAAIAFARDLNSRGFHGQTIALGGDKSLNFYASLLGVWLSGNHFVPVPVGCPPARLAHIYELAKPVFALGSALPLAASPQPWPADTAYLIFTSGSSGRPKGCRITEENLLAYLRGIEGFYDFSTSDAISQAFDLSFDPSLSDILWAFLSGAKLCPLHFSELANLGDYFERENITVWNSSPSLARLALDSGSLTNLTFPQIRLSTFIGEKLSSSIVRAWQSIAPKSSIENLYGPAEATISVSRYAIAPEQTPIAIDGNVPIGAPNPGVTFTVKDGELLITGAQVGAGYLGPDPGDKFRGQESSATYQSGDHCHQLESGEWVLTGRVDSQCKIAGQRFEPGEVESLAENHGFSGFVALPWRRQSSSEAYDSLLLLTILDVDQNKLEEMNRLFTQHLPAFARPIAIHRLQHWPLNAAGKLDRPALEGLVIERKAVKIFPR